MKFTGNQLLKACCLVSSVVTSIVWVIYFKQLFERVNGIQLIDYIMQKPNITTYPLFCIFSIIILVKANSSKGILWFSLFLSVLSQNIVLTHFFIQNPGYDAYSIATLSFILTSIAYLKSVQNFPQVISVKDIQREFSKNKLLRGYLAAFLQNWIWIIFSVFVFGLATVFPKNVMMEVSCLLLVLFTAMPFLYLNFKISNPSSRNKISWLFWGILCYTFLSVLNSILLYSGSDMQQNIVSLFNILRALSLFISVTMCLFFFDTFDTGVLIRRTIVDGIIFIVIVFLYNTVEHYFLHWMTHKLHISSTLVSSVLSGFFVLIFSPLHHKFMHVLDERFKRKEIH